MSSEGREFVVCFPKNDVKENNTCKMKLYIIPVENQFTKIKIETFLNGNQIKEYNTNGKEFIEIDFSSDFEVLSNSENEKKAIFVNSDYNIALVGISNKLHTADAFLVLPVHSLDTLYTVASYNSLFLSKTHLSANRYSNCTIVGLEDSTTVNFIPSDKIRIDSQDVKVQMSFSINKGETRMIESGHYGIYDITSSIISGNKKIAVFSGHQRAAIPEFYNEPDVLIENIPSISIMGCKAIFTPTSFPNFKPKCYIRIIAANDSTRVIYNNIDTIINRFQYIQSENEKALSIKTDKPVLFVQYERSVISFVNGDPFMTVQAPIEQYINNYTFISIPMHEFNEHWINITIPENGISSLVMDGIPFSDSLFQKVDGTEYYWASIKVNKGIHKIKSNSAFGVLVYGYGIATSYGYCGGMKTERLLEKIMDSNKPQLNKNEGCSTQLEFTEKNEYDSGIDLVTVTESENVTVSINPFQKGDKEVTVNLKLENEYKDGFVIIKTQDIKGLARFDTLNLNGFEITSDFDSFSDSIAFLEFRCDSINLMNKSNYPNTFRIYFDKNTQISVPPYYEQITLAGGMDTLIPFCLYAESISEISDKLKVKDNCGRGYEYEIKYKVRELFFETVSKCSTLITLTVSEDIKEFLSNNHINSDKIIYIYNLIGFKVYSGKAGELSSKLASGVYSIIVYDENILINRMLIKIEY